MFVPLCVNWHHVVHRPDPPHSLAELKDVYERRAQGLALTPYADVTFVDKQMGEAFKQASMKDPPLARICNRVERAVSYRDIPRLVGSPGG